MSWRANRLLFHCSGRLTEVAGTRIHTWDRHWSGVHRMGHPIHKRGTVHLIPTKRGEPGLWLDGFASVVESQEFLQVGLHHCEAGVDGCVAESVCEEGEVGEAWVWVAGFDVAGTSDCIEHRL